jgi:hypothetical protein
MKIAMIPIIALLLLTINAIADIPMPPPLSPEQLCEGKSRGD